MNKKVNSNLCQESVKVSLVRRFLLLSLKPMGNGKTLFMKFEFTQGTSYVYTSVYFINNNQSQSILFSPAIFYGRSSHTLAAFLLGTEAKCSFPFSWRQPEWTNAASHYFVYCRREFGISESEASFLSQRNATEFAKTCTILYFLQQRFKDKDKDLFISY